MPDELAIRLSPDEDAYNRKTLPRKVLNMYARAAYTESYFTKYGFFYKADDDT